MAFTPPPTTPIAVPNMFDDPLAMAQCGQQLYEAKVLLPICEKLKIQEVSTPDFFRLKSLLLFIYETLDYRWKNHYLEVFKSYGVAHLVFPVPVESRKRSVDVMTFDEENQPSPTSFDPKRARVTPPFQTEDSEWHERMKLFSNELTAMNARARTNRLTPTLPSLPNQRNFSATTPRKYLSFQITSNGINKGPDTYFPRHVNPSINFIRPEEASTPGRPPAFNVKYRIEKPRNVLIRQPKPSVKEVSKEIRPVATAYVTATSKLTLHDLVSNGERSNDDGEILGDSPLKNDDKVDELVDQVLGAFGNEKSSNGQK